jgi:hypothetical protein
VPQEGTLKTFTLNHHARRFPFFALALAITLTLVQTSQSSIAQGTAPAAPLFSVQRGFFEAPFSVTLSAGSGTTIRYTTDGSTPSSSSGTIYSGGINITRTTALRAIAYASAASVSPVATHSYIFLAGVRAQSATPLPGWPSSFAAPDSVYASPYPTDYEMDPEVLNHPNNAGNVFTNAMRAIPSISIVTDLDKLWNPSTGIYYNPRAKEPYTPDPLGTKWERPISIEWIDPAGGPGFAENGGMRIQGQASRRPSRQPKKNFRVYFKAAYGAPRLSFSLFDYADPVSKFDRLVLRNGGNRSWPYVENSQRADADYVNDEWARRAWLQMGWLAPHGAYAHVYLNGLYWGLYNVTERIDEKFLSSYLGGTDLDYEVVEAEEELQDIPVADPGTITEYNNVLAIVTGTVPMSDGAFNQLKTKVDLIALADYFVHVHYIGKQDWPHHNYNLYRKLTGADTRFRFVPWDNDSGLRSLTTNNTLFTDQKGPDDAPSLMFLRAATHPEFRQILADRFYRHVIAPGGALTPANCTALYTQLTNIVDQAVIAESARWGDYGRDVYPASIITTQNFPAYLHSRDLPHSFTDPSNIVVDDVDQKTWVQWRANRLSSYCPNRSSVVSNQYIANGWYTTTLRPPTLSQYGGAVASGYSLRLNNVTSGGAGDLYYTTDGSDPRLEFGGLAPTATLGSDSVNLPITRITTVKARVKNGAAWSPLAEFTFYTPQTYGNLLINEIHYNPIAALPANPDDYEFLELYNKGTTPIELEGVNFGRAFSYRFPAGANIAPGQYLVISSKTTAFQTRYSFASAGNYRGKLANEGDTVELRDPFGALIDSVSYGNAAPWPVAPNGTGPSLILISPDYDNSVATSWLASNASNGSPGAVNSIALPPTPTITPTPLPATATLAPGTGTPVVSVTPPGTGTPGPTATPPGDERVYIPVTMR